MRFLQRKRGFSLIELSVVMLLAALVLSLSLPSWRSLLLRNQDQVAQNRFLEALRYARQAALIRQQVITLSPDQGDLVVYTQGEVLRIFQLSLPAGSLHWRSFPRNQASCEFLPNGRTNFENGTFWFCRAGEKNAVWAIAVSQAGNVHTNPLIKCRVD